MKRFPLVTAISLGLVLALGAPGCGDDDDTETMTGDGDGDGDGDTEVTIPFRLVSAGSAVTCGASFTAGTEDTSVDLLDAQMYVTNVRLLDASGNEAPVQLTAGDFQSETVALLDFSGSGGKCEGAGETNSEVLGTVAAGEYVGLAFDVGIPFEENHGELAQAETPLDNARMYWAWAIGYKFMRFDISYGDDPADRFNFHLGSHMCANGTDPFDPSVPPSDCSRSNRAEVRFATGFTPGQSVVALDLAALYGGLDVTLFEDAMRPGCQSFPDEATECQPVYDGLDLAFDTGECKTAGCAGQSAFGLE